MTFKTAAFARLVATLLAACPVLALAQAPERLSRPVPTSATGPGGTLRVSGDATVGNFTVDSFAAFGRKALDPKTDPRIISALTTIICPPAATGSVAGYAVGEALKDVSRNERKRLKAGDPASLASLAAGAIAKLDGVSADAIRADEAMGPGVYHDAVFGMRTALITCKFFGQRL